MELRKIASFQVDHTKIDRGLYISRIDGDIVTYDIRMKKPNAGDYISNGALHTIEHLGATYLRSSDKSEGIIYFGPMGCRTGCYTVFRGISRKDAIRLVREMFAFLAEFEGPIPGATEFECGNWREHDLADAKAEAQAYLPVLDGYTEDMLDYTAQRTIRKN
jgi:S-ribosylhomocysteine lyase